MNGIGKQAAFYRGYVPDDRSLVLLTALLSTTLALWLLVYLVAAVAEAHQDAGAGRFASITVGSRRPLSGDLGSTYSRSPQQSWSAIESVKDGIGRPPGLPGLLAELRGFEPLTSAV
jgi:hypothetical protein